MQGVSMPLALLPGSNVFRGPEPVPYPPPCGWISYPPRHDNSNQASIASKLEALASAYNDIQDRLYEIDKSWKNNLMIYGVPCAENIEEDTVITEEKVMELVVTCDIPRHANIGIHKTHMRSNMRIHRYSVNRVCIMYIVRIHVSRYLRRTW